MVLVSLGLSLAIVRLLGTGKNMNFNTIMVPIQPKPGDVSGENDDIVFNYKEKETYGNRIYIKNMFPTSDAVGKKLSGDFYTFEFSLYYGNKSKGRYYEITAEMLDECTLNEKYVKIYLESDNEPLDSVIDKNGRVKLYTEYKNATVDKNNNREKLIYAGTINNQDIALGHKNFVLRMWVSDEYEMVPEMMDKTFAIRINVYAK